MLVVGEGAGHTDGDEECLGKEPSQLLSIQASGGRPLQELSMSKETSGGRPLQELSSKEASDGRPFQLLLNQEATPWMNPTQIPAQIPQIERSPSRPESQQRLAGEQIKFSRF